MPNANNGTPQVGDLAPDFNGATQTGETVRLSALRGQKVALYFYPKDDTPGCSKQACNLRDNYAELLDAGIAIVGVSADNVASHEEFADKFDLPFPLVADPEREIVTTYGVWGEKNLYGNIFMGIKRTTFLIDEKGRVVHVFRRPRVKEHSREIMDRFTAA